MRFFRCLALYKGDRIHKLELKANPFLGEVFLADLPDLERKGWVLVYSLRDDGTGADLVR